jgi:HEAT repeat protein
MRGEALEQIGCLKIPRRDVLAFLSTLLGHANVEIAFWAAYALGEIGDESVVPALVHTAAADNRELLPFGTIREEATKAIEMIHARAPAARHPSD